MYRVFAIPAVLLLVASVGYGWHAGAHVREASRALEKCADADSACMTPIIGDLALSDGTGAAFQLLKDTYPRLGQPGNRCFELAGHVGTYIAQHQQDAEQLRFEPKSNYCNYGLYQSYSRESLLISKDTEKARMLCKRIESAMEPYSTGATDECFRGVGHALPFIKNDIQGDVRAMALYAAATCETLAPDGTRRDACLSGVFSNLGSAQRSSSYGLHPPRGGDPMQLCRQIPSKYLRYCETNFKRTMLDGISAVADLTSTLQDLRNKYPKLTRDDILSVSYTIGYDNMHAAMPDPDFDSVVSHCASTDTDIWKECVRGLSVGLAKNGTPGEQDKQFEPFCDSVRTAYGDAAPPCPAFSALIYLKGFFTEKKFRAMCEHYNIPLERCGISD